MPSNLPKISIVTPSFNQGQFLEKTIQSVLNQNYPNLEYIVIDGGSTDESTTILKQYDKHIDYWVSEKDTGQSNAINKGFSHCTGEIINWLNSDDILLPGALHTVAEAFSCASNNVAAVRGLGKIVNTQGKTVHQPSPYNVTYNDLLGWLNGKDFMQPSCFFRRSAFEELGPLNENLHYSMDIDLWLKIAKHYEFKSIPEELSLALAHDAAKTTANTARMKIETLLMFMLHGEFDTADKEGRKVADLLHTNYHAYRLVKKNLFFRLFLKPFLRNRLKNIRA